jgi:hypothetical protein
MIQEITLFETTNPGIGNSVWIVLEKMTVACRKKLTTNHDFPVVVRHGYQREVATDKWSIYRNVPVWTFTEEVEGFFELCDILASTEE